MRRILLTLVTVSGLLLAPACVSRPVRPVAGGRAEIVELGEPFQTARGEVFVLRIQDEYRLIRCIPDGPIAGCYEDVLTVPDADVRWNEWVDVPRIPGLRLSFVTPTTVAVAQQPASNPADR